jgi:hypothetical protein
MFSLAPLQPVARLEMLYVLQQRDTRGADLYPEVVRRAIVMLRDLPCFALAGDAIPDLIHASRNALNRGLLCTVQWEISTAFDQFRGVDPAQKLVWDLRTVSQQIPSLKRQGREV